jgi:hypothetical protein
LIITIFDHTSNHTCLTGNLSLEDRKGKKKDKKQKKEMLSFVHVIPPIKKFGLKPLFLDLDFDRSGQKELSLGLDPGTSLASSFSHRSSRCFSAAMC